MACKNSEKVGHQKGNHLYNKCIKYEYLEGQFYNLISLDSFGVIRSLGVDFCWKIKEGKSTKQKGASETAEVFAHPKLGDMNKKTLCVLNQRR